METLPSVSGDQWQESLRGETPLQTRREEDVKQCRVHRAPTGMRKVWLQSTDVGETRDRQRSQETEDAEDIQRKQTKLGETRKLRLENMERQQRHEGLEDDTPDLSIIFHSGLWKGDQTCEKKNI